MRKYVIRFINAIKVFYVAYNKPEIMVHDTFESLIGLWTLLFKVAEEKRPYMTELAGIRQNGEREVLLTLWAGYGANSSPMERLKELITENDKLKKEIQILKGLDFK